MKIEINPEYQSLEKFIRSIPQRFDSEGTIIYEARNVLCTFTVDGVELVVKRFKKPHLINRFVYGTIRKSKAYRSYHYALRLLEKGIRTPKPIAYIENYGLGLRYSYYISLHSPLTREIREFTEKEDIEDELYVLKAFGLYSAYLHENNVLHLDYSPGNILFGMLNGELTFSLVDINRMKFTEVSEEEGYKNFRRLYFLDKAYKVVAEAYAEGRGFDKDKATERILFYKNQFIRRRG